ELRSRCSRLAIPSTLRRGLAQPAEASRAMPPKRPPDSLGRPLIQGRDTINTSTGRGAAWLARLAGAQEVPGSNPGAPTYFLRRLYSRSIKSGIASRRSVI